MHNIELACSDDTYGSSRWQRCCPSRVWLSDSNSPGMLISPYSSTSDAACVAASVDAANANASVNFSNISFGFHCVLRINVAWCSISIKRMTNCRLRSHGSGCLSASAPDCVRSANTLSKLTQIPI